MVPGNRHRQATRPEAPADVKSSALSDSRLDALLRRDGRVQFGTLGRGNHFLEFQRDDENRLWLMVHSGSRAMGQAIRSHHLLQSTRGARGLSFLDAREDIGRAYLTDAEWARRYARASRCAMVEAAAVELSKIASVAMDSSSYFDCDHNHVQRETHFGEERWVHRKGAASAASGQIGALPGSMGTESFHVEGRGHAASLCSSAHGAGRKMSREQASRSISTRELLRQTRGVWFDSEAAALLRDEAPSAYKDIRAVIRAQRELTRVVRRLRPVLNYKAT